MTITTPVQGCPPSVASRRAAGAAHPDFFDHDAAAAAWAALARRLAGRPAMRPARIVRGDGKRRAVYDRGDTPITATLPAAPAAVLLYDVPDRAAARIRVLAFDLDAKARIDGAPAGREAAAGDADRIAEAVRRAGGACIVSAGPTGGHHVWVPLAQPLPLSAAATLAHALRRACPTLDPAPLGNAATGCLRPPGAPHAAGGWQALLGTLPSALDALDRPNGPEVVDALWDLAVPAGTPAGADDARQHQPVAAGRRPLQARWEQLAAAGPRPGQFRDDASLARWYVVQAAVRAGWAGEEWVAAIAGWPWLAGQYAARPDLALYEFEKAAGQWRLRGHVQIPDTSRYFLHGGGQGQSTTPRDQPQPEPLHRRLRQVRTWLQGTARSGRMSPAVHAVGRAVLLFAHATASHRIQVGVRALAVAAAVSRTTAAAALWELEAAGLIRRAGRGIGRGADVWEIDLALGEGLRPAAGRLWATRPVFRIIGGHGAAEVYEALAGAGGPLSARQVAGMLGRSPTTVAGHLHELGAWGLAVGGGRDGWAIGPADPDELAVRLGAHGLVAAQVAGYRAERAAWWAWLEAKGLDRPGRRTPGPCRVVLLPPPPRQRHQPAARGDRAGPDTDVDAAITLLRPVRSPAAV